MGKSTMQMRTAESENVNVKLCGRKVIIRCLARDPGKKDVKR